MKTEKQNVIGETREEFYLGKGAHTIIWHIYGKGATEESVPLVDGTVNVRAVMAGGRMVCDQGGDASAIRGWRSGAGGQGS